VPDYRIESGIEVAIHSARKSSQDKNSECLLLVDAKKYIEQTKQKSQSQKHQKTMSVHICLFTQQLQHSCQTVFGIQGQHTVTGGYDTWE